MYEGLISAVLVVAFIIGYSFEKNEIIKVAWLLFAATFVVLSFGVNYNTCGTTINSTATVNNECLPAIDGNLAVFGIIAIAIISFATWIILFKLAVKTSQNFVGGKK